MTEKSPAIFENYQIRRHYDEQKEAWYFSVVDIIQVLIQQPDFQTARKYWNKLKERLKKEGSESVTNCHRLKTEAADGKKYLTDAADPETLLRLIQSVPSPKAELIFTALAELSTRQIAESVDTSGMAENSETGKKGGKIAKGARLELEAKTGKSEVTGENFLPPKKTTKRFESGADKEADDE
jgi:hypothetical protein